MMRARLAALLRRWADRLAPEPEPVALTGWLLRPWNITLSDNPWMDDQAA